MKSLAGFIFASLLLIAFAAVDGASYNNWKGLGPGGALDVQPDNMEVSSAANDVVKVGKYLLLATVNGGVWRTSDTKVNPNSRPHWENVFDSQPVTCQSMTSLHASAFKPGTVYAACGASTSSQMGYKWNIRNTGDFAGFAVSTDSGSTWKMAAFPPGYSVEDVAELSNGAVAVTVRGSFTDPTDGGVWVSSNIFDQKSWKNTLTNKAPTFHLRFDNTTKSLYASTATLASDKAVYVSKDFGQTWATLTTGLTFSGGQVPFYSCLALIPGKALFLGTMLAPSNFLDKGLGAGYGQVFYLDLTKAAPSWQVVGAQPMNPNAQNPTKDCSYTCNNPDCCLTIDNDYSEKDRMGIFVIPGNDDFLFVSGNAGSLTYRIDWKTALGKPPCTYNYTSGTCFNSAVDLYTWKPMWNQGAPFKDDTKSNAQPHVDTRNWGYDSETQTLFLVSDGGIFARTFPTESGKGDWYGFSGDIGTFEYLHASFDFSEKRFVAAAQDNNVHISARDSFTNSKAPARSWTGGDGTFTSIDNSRNPVRFYGTYQFAGGLSYVPADFTTTPQQASVPIPLSKRGLPLIGTLPPRQGASILPFFQTPYHINRYNPDYLYMWANTSTYNDNNQQNPGFFKLNVADASSGANATPLLSTDGENIIDFVAGGMVDGKTTEDVIVAVSGKYLFTRYNGVTAKVKLPYEFAEPITDGVPDYCNFVDFIVPCTLDGKMTWPNHGMSMSVAVHPSDAKTIAVTGWPRLDANAGTERIIVTTDNGKTWNDVIGNLKTATGTIGMVRPKGLAFIGNTALLVGTVNGIFMTKNYTSTTGVSWDRVGDYQQFPRVISSSLNYYPEEDLLLVATMGRGVFATTLACRSLTDGPCFPLANDNKWSPKKKALAIALGVSIPCVFILIGLFIWKKKTSGGTGSKGGSDSEYKRVGDRPDGLAQA